MGLENPVNRIEDLDPTWPLGTDDVNEGDDHIRNVKAALLGSFPDLGPDQVTRTAVELSNTVLTFNGRPPDAEGEITPQGGDYTLGQLGNVNVTPTNDGDILVFNQTDSEWQSQAPGTLPQVYPDDGWYSADLVDNGSLHQTATDGTLYFPGLIQNDQSNGLLTFKNDSTNGTGWRVTANNRVQITVSISAGSSILSSSYTDMIRNDVLSIAFKPFLNDESTMAITGTTILPKDAHINFKGGEILSRMVISISAVRVG